MVRTGFSVGFSLVVAVLVACGGGDGGGSGDDADAGGGGADSGGSGPCDHAADCDGDEICNASGDCESGVACDEHGDCGAGGHCVSDVCEPNVTGGTCDDDVNCPVGDTCISGFCGCEGEAFAAAPTTPQMMIVLDRSGSMDEDLDGDCQMVDDDNGECDRPPYDPGDHEQNPDWTAPDKWTVASDAMDVILASHASSVRFGLVTFSSNDGGDSCAPGDVEVDIADDNAAPIQAEIDATGPLGSTPIGDTLDALVGHASLLDTGYTNYVLLVTDGQETCSGDPVAAAQALFDQTPSVKTFVVGFGGGVDEDELDAVAVAGGTARPDTDPHRYYEAGNDVELQAALDSILGAVALSCVYTLDQTPDDPNQLYIYADSNPVGRDMTQTEGWDYDAGSNTVTFYGQICQDLNDGVVSDLSIVYGCPGEVVE